MNNASLQIVKPIRKGRKGVAFGWEVDSLQRQMELAYQAIISLKTRGGGGGVFPVWVTQVGGSAGTASTQCTFTYDVFTDSAKTTGNKIGTAVSLVKSRLLNCAMTAGTQGLAYYHPETGVLTLWDVNERMTQAECEPEA